MYGKLSLSHRNKMKEVTDTSQEVGSDFTLGRTDKVVMNVLVTLKSFKERQNYDLRNS